MDEQPMCFLVMQEEKKNLKSMHKSLAGVGSEKKK